MNSSSTSPLRILLKALILSLLMVGLSAALNTEPLGRLSLYNRIFPGRERLPFGENQQQAYNLSLYNLQAMFASHEINGLPRDDGKYHIFLLGDSSVWGILLPPTQTLAGQLNALDLTVCGKPVRFYNLGYPTLSLTKDLMLLDLAMRYQPDQIVWLTTLESFPQENQLLAPIVGNNPERARALIRDFGLNLDPQDPDLAKQSFLERSLIGQRRNLADLLRLQLYGVMWAATGIDQLYPEHPEHAATDLASDPTFHGRQPPAMDPASLSLNVLDAGFQRAGDVPILLVNEPILVSKGLNSDIRYNFFYPRWAYDQYRSLLSTHAAAKGWRYLDLWNIIPADEFTNTAIHLSPSGEASLAQRIGLELTGACPSMRP